MQLRTERLLLRPAELADAQAIFDAYASDPEATKYLVFETLTDVAQASEYIERTIRETLAGKSFTWSILLRESRQLIGAIDLHHVEEQIGGIGFAIGKRWWGQGYVPEAARAVLAFARASLRLARVNGMCDHENLRPARVFEKLGFESLGIKERAAVHPAFGPEPRAVRYFTLDLTLTLRPATQSDRAFVERVYFETQRWIIENLFGWRGDRIERAKFDEFYDERNTAIIATNRSDVGWLTVVREPDRIEIDSIYLLPERQRQGIGTHLLQQLVDEAGATHKIVTISAAKINPARRLYERLGFSVVKETEFKAYLERQPPR